MHCLWWSVTVYQKNISYTKNTCIKEASLAIFYLVSLWITLWKGNILESWDQGYASAMCQTPGLADPVAYYFKERSHQISPKRISRVVLDGCLSVVSVTLFTPVTASELLCAAIHLTRASHLWASFVYIVLMSDEGLAGRWKISRTFHPIKLKRFFLAE